MTDMALHPLAARPKLDQAPNPLMAIVFAGLVAVSVGFTACRLVTVGEKIGKSHLTYAQGASAELVAAATIAAADVAGLPVSTVRNLPMAWVLTLPAAILLSGGLYVLFRQLF